jgi:hypothetical protein
MSLLEQRPSYLYWEPGAQYPLCLHYDTVVQGAFFAPVSLPEEHQRERNAQLAAVTADDIDEQTQDEPDEQEDDAAQEDDDELGDQNLGEHESEAQLDLHEEQDNEDDNAGVEEDEDNADEDEENEDDEDEEEEEDTDKETAAHGGDEQHVDDEFDSETTGDTGKQLTGTSDALRAALGRADDPAAWATITTIQLVNSSHVNHPGYAIYRSSEDDAD